MGCGVVAPPGVAAAPPKRLAPVGFGAGVAPLPKTFEVAAGLFCSPAPDVEVALPKFHVCWGAVAPPPNKLPPPPPDVDAGTVPNIPLPIFGCSPGVPAGEAVGILLPNIPVGGAAELVGAGSAGFCCPKLKPVLVFPAPPPKTFDVLPDAPPNVGLF